MPVHQISYNDALTMIYNFISTLGSAAADIGVGGTINSEDLTAQTSGSVPGTLFWYCFNYENNIADVPAFFVAFETHNVDYQEAPENCFNETLHFSGSVFTYKGQATMAAINTFLTTQVQTPSSAIEISDSDTERLAEWFLSDYPSGNANPYNENSCGFFNADEMNAFLTQSGNYPYVRYVLGLDESITDQQIRLLLFPVDSSGVMQTERVVIMQHSWPPGTV